MEDVLKKPKVLKYGYYSLFENVYGRRVLVLDREEWYSWINEDLGPTLVYSDPMVYSEAKGTASEYKLIMEGRYYLEDIEADPLRPHLFLQDNDIYMEIILPQGLPGIVDISKIINITDHTFPKEYVESLDNLKEAVVHRNNYEKGSDIY
jgi:hypothetical protein